VDINRLLEIIVKRNASDLHLVSGRPPMLRLNKELQIIPSYQELSEEEVKTLVLSLLNEEQKISFLSNHELDFSYSSKIDGFENRFRVNAYFQKNSVAASLRYIPCQKIRSFRELNLPESFSEFAKLNQGLVLITGPTGHGKTTTIATLIHEINMERNVHIVTIEDPIEYTYPKGKALISQREMRGDTYSWEVALRSVLREDPDVVFIGEMRDYETIAATLTIAETGHLVLATLHTNSAAQTIDRVVDVFPSHQQPQIRLQFSNTLSGIISQRLLPALNGSLVPAIEVLISTPAVRTTIREGKTHLIDNIIQTSKDIGMITLEEYLATLVSSGKVSLEIARHYALRPEELRRFLKK